jgi:hypothetical protein
VETHAHKKRRDGYISRHAILGSLFAPLGGRRRGKNLLLSAKPAQALLATHSPICKKMGVWHAFSVAREKNFDH